MDSSPLPRLALGLCLLAVGVACSSTAITAQQGARFDAPYHAAQAKHADAWQAEDADIDARLAALRERTGKRPNIIYILADDVGWGELGWQGGGKHRGTPTPELDRMAFEGMRLWHAYAEPSCTPTRIAINTGRHPVRTGLLSVLWPGQEEGLSPDEITTAELLSDAGYDTAMWGKWHLGEAPEQAPENQGFDYAYYGLFNGAPDMWPDSHSAYDEPFGGKMPFHDFPGIDAYKEMTGIDLSVAGYVGRKGGGREPIAGPAGKLGAGRQAVFEKESIEQILSYVDDHANDDADPFFVYWATYANQITGAEDFQDAPHVDRANPQASFFAQHSSHVGRLLTKLRETGLAENTLVVWISDNGPMYAFFPNSGYSYLRGGKGSIYEGGVRVPAMAWWPGMIEADQDPLDVMHVTDLHTTAARLAGALDAMPGDRVTDGLDQLPLFLNGEGHGRRHYMFHYSGGQLAALRWHDFKVVFTGEQKGGLPVMEFYNVKRDPRETHGAFYAGLFAVTPLQDTIKSHMGLIARYPHRTSELMPKGAEMTPHD